MSTKKSDLPRPGAKDKNMEASHEGTMGLGLYVKVRKLLEEKKKSPFKCPPYIIMDLLYFIIFHFKNKTNSKSISFIGCNSLFCSMFYFTFVLTMHKSINHLICIGNSLG